MRSMNIPNSQQTDSIVTTSDEITASQTFNIDEAKRFISFIRKYKENNKLDQIYIRIPGDWRSDDASRKMLLDYLKDSLDYVIIETSPVLRAYFKTELTLRHSDPKKILKERK